MGKNRVFGGTWQHLLAEYDQTSSCWRTCQQSLFEEAEKYLEALPKSGMMQNGQLYQLNNLVHPICDEDGFSLPTPTATDPYKHGSNGLVRLIEKGLKYSKGDHRNLPTPTAHLAKEQGSPAEYKRKTKSLICHFISEEERQTIGKKARLNPHFVVWMMGFPIDWLD